MNKSQLQTASWTDTVQACIDGKWTKLALKPESDESICLLCEKTSLSIYSTFNCKNCPVPKVSGYSLCQNTPYDKWMDLHCGMDNVLDDELSAAAYDEIAFLYEVKIYCIEKGI